MPHRHRSLDARYGAIADEIDNAHSLLDLARDAQQVTPSKFEQAVRALNELVLQVRIDHSEIINLVLEQTDNPVLEQIYSSVFEQIKRILDTAINGGIIHHTSQRPRQ